MKKFLLFALTAIFAVSASAQSLSKRNSGIKKSKSQVSARTSEVKKISKKDWVVKEKQNTIHRLSKDNFLAKLSRGAEAYKAGKSTAKKATRKAGTVQATYNASGISSGASVEWTMTSGNDNGTLTFTNVISGGDWDFLNDITVEYTIEGNAITIQPQYVAENEYQGEMDYVYIFDANTEDGVISLTLNDDGSIATDAIIYYGAFSAKAFDTTFGTYTGSYVSVSKISYLLPGQIKAPTVFYEPDGLYLTRGTSPSWYASTTTFTYIPANAETKFLNYTQDAADTWSWSCDRLNSSGSEVEEALTSNTLDFSLNTNKQQIYTQPILIGSNKGAESDPYQWSVRRTKTAGYIFSAGDMSDDEMPDGTFAQYSKCDPANRVTTARHLGTPTINSNKYNLSNLIFYQGKPAGPLYFEGISLWVGSFTKTEDFNLKCKIVKVTRDPETLSLTLGDVVAEAEVDQDDLFLDDEDPADVWALLNWNEFYAEDEDGMTNTVDYIMMEDEFAIVFEGWNNGTFTAVPITEYSGDMVNSVSTTCQYINLDGDESIYGFFKNYTHPYVSFKGAAYGYLFTNDNTNIEFPEEGGEKTIHIEPMFSTSDGGTLIGVDQNSEVPEWISLEIGNEVYTDDEYSFDLVVTADPLTSASGAPRKEAAAGRQATFTLMQPGAKLDITVTQGTVTGISDVKVTKTATDGKVYNVAGQRLNSNAKGLIIKDGKKFIVK